LVLSGHQHHPNRGYDYGCEEESCEEEEEDREAEGQEEGEDLIS
jgi:hypothetical protein